MHGRDISIHSMACFFFKNGPSIPALVLALLPTYINAANVGPGPISPVNQSTVGTTTIVGDTSITTSTNAVTVSNGTVELGGPNIQIQTSGTGFGFNVDATSNQVFLTSLLGSTISIVTTGSTFSYGLWASNANQIATATMITLSNATIRTSGNGSGGVVLAHYASGIFNNFTIETSGGRDPGNNNAGAYGINTQFNAQGSFDKVSILTHGVGGTGILNTNTSYFSGNDFSINVEGQGSYGINTQTAANTIFNNATILTQGESGIGIRVSNANFSSTGLYSTFTGTNLTVETLGEGASAVITRADSHANVSNIQVRTSGIDAAGIYALESGSQLTVNNGSIQTQGTNGYGALSRIGASLVVNNSNITTLGNQASGLYVEAADPDPASTTAQINNSRIQTYNTGSHGLEMLNGGTINTSNTEIITEGSAAFGLLITNAAEYTSNVNITGGSLSSHNAAGMGIIGGESTVHLNNTIVTGNNNWLIVGKLDVVTDPPSVIPVPDDDSDGDATNPLLPIQSKLVTNQLVPKQPLMTLSPLPTLATITANHSELNGAALTFNEAISTVILENGSLWNMTGSSNLANLVNAESTIDFSAPINAYKTLTVTNYTGMDGTIALNTFLQEDNSPSDQLVIINEGSAIGSTGLVIKNSGGLGALTTENGILVINAEDGTTEGTAFYLAQPAAAGPYNYLLYRGSVDDSAPESWYLRSTLKPNEPDYRPEVSLYSAIYSNLMNFSRTSLGTFHQRVGAEEQVHNPRAQSKESAYMNGGWLRVINRGGNVHDRGILAHGPNFNYQLYAVQAGIDVFHYEHDKGQRDFAGFYLTSGGGYSSVRHYNHTKAGDANFDAYGFGLYWTHIGRNDWYVDGVFQGNYFEPNAHSKYMVLDPIKTQSYTVSVEAGYPFQLWNNWRLAPEGQLMYQNLPGTRSADPAASLRFSTSNSFITRLGTRLIWDKFANESKESQRKTTVWLTPSFSYESQGLSKTSFSSETGWVPFTSSLRGTWFSLDLGGTIQINEVMSLYGTVVGETYLNGRGQAYDVMAGLRFNL